MSTDAIIWNKILAIDASNVSQKPESTTTKYVPPPPWECMDDLTLGNPLI